MRQGLRSGPLFPLALLRRLRRRPGRRSLRPSDFGIHFITGTTSQRNARSPVGASFHFKDGREMPNLIETLYDYPDFRVTVRCNLNNDGGEFIGFYGTQGTMMIKDST